MYLFCSFFLLVSSTKLTVLKALIDVEKSGSMAKELVIEGLLILLHIAETRFLNSSDSTKWAERLSTKLFESISSKIFEHISAILQSYLTADKKLQDLEKQILQLDITISPKSSPQSKPPTRFPPTTSASPPPSIPPVSRESLLKENAALKTQKETEFRSLNKIISVLLTQTATLSDSSIYLITSPLHLILDLNLPFSNELRSNLFELIRVILSKRDEKAQKSSSNGNDIFDDPSL